MAYTIIIPNSVKKDLDRLPNSAFRKVLLLLHQLEVNPRPSGCKKLKGRNAWRARAGGRRGRFHSPRCPECLARKGRGLPDHL